MPPTTLIVHVFRTYSEAKEWFSTGGLLVTDKAVFKEYELTVRIGDMMHIAVHHDDNENYLKQRLIGLRAAAVVLHNQWRPSEELAFFLRAVVLRDFPGR